MSFSLRLMPFKFGQMGVVIKWGKTLPLTFWFVAEANHAAVGMGGWIWTKA